MFCRHCGSEMKDDAHFCSNCNKPVDENPSSKSSASSKKMIAILIVGLILLFIIASVAAIIVIGMRNFSEKEEPTEATVTEPATEAPTEAPTDPNPIPASNIYRDCYTATEFVLPESSTRYYAPAELKELSDEALQVARIEISARHGGVINDLPLNEYFQCLSWYTPGSNPITYNTFEEENLFLIDVCMRQRDGSIYNSSNPYMSYAIQDNTYFLTESDSRYITGDELYQLSETGLILARNEIFARHGYIFSDDILQEYFCCKSWYRPAILSKDFDTKAFCDQESANIKLIGVYEDIANGVGLSGSNPYSYVKHYYTSNGYVLPHSSSRKISIEELYWMNPPELIIARNEIFARNGYSFTDKELMAYFLSCSWYRPQVAPGRLDLISLNSTERANVNLLLEYQKFIEGDGPAPTEKPTEPKPTEPKPTEPKPTEPKPTEPPVTEPPATEPPAIDPTPTDPPAPALPEEPEPTEDPEINVT